jgi:hypothetical protein
MSGGSFNYAFARLYDFADELSDRLENSDKPNEYGELPYSFDQPTLAKLREILQLACYTADLIHQVEWLYSGDICVDTFMENVAMLGEKK